MGLCTPGPLKPLITQKRRGEPNSQINGLRYHKVVKHRILKKPHLFYHICSYKVNISLLYYTFKLFSGLKPPSSLPLRSESVSASPSARSSCSPSISASSFSTSPSPRGVALSGLKCCSLGPPRAASAPPWGNSDHMRRDG